MNILLPSELMAETDTLEYHVHQVLPVCSLITLWAPSGIGKTFVMLDLALHVAAGKPWHGLAVQQAPVLYVVGEGFAGMRSRVAAWCAEHDTLIRPGWIRGSAFGGSHSMSRRPIRATRCVLNWRRSGSRRAS
ncbi:AAA family ATPase [Gemmatimonas sp.]|uniref:AAA family ATPase n=1 Tax=Gemmatimonas sp. TaxID=1962908 RepID=UPI00286D5C8F|nr:AAA family ATPase [Gemmatimonas sp.]